MTFTVLFRRVLLSCALLGSAAVSCLHAQEIPTLAPGACALGSTNMEIAETQPRPMIDYLNGSNSEGKMTYLSDILLHAESVPSFSLQVPDNKEVYGSFAGKPLPMVLYILYPTAKDNPRPDYKFPYKDTGDSVFPHMQVAGEKPLFADPKAKYPLIVFSSGYNAHGLWDLSHLKVIASHGYIVVSVFYGDSRASVFDNLNLRPLEVRQALNTVLAHPDFGPAIDKDRIGLSGASFGGYTTLCALGGKYNKTLPSDPDPRVKAGFGLVPYMGGMFAWPFGQDYAGLKPVTKPFLAVYGEKDQNVAPETVQGGIVQLSGTYSAVMLDGEVHALTEPTRSDYMTWEVLFFDAWLKGDESARKLVYEHDSVTGGVHDHKTHQRIVETAKTPAP